jgi:hypothetical protein
VCSARPPAADSRLLLSSSDQNDYPACLPACPPARRWQMPLSRQNMCATGRGGRQVDWQGAPALPAATASCPAHPAARCCQGHTQRAWLALPQCLTSLPACPHSLLSLAAWTGVCCRWGAACSWGRRQSQQTSRSWTILWGRQARGRPWPRCAAAGDCGGGGAGACVWNCELKYVVVCTVWSFAWLACPGLVCSRACPSWPCGTPPALPSCLQPFQVTMDRQAMLVMDFHAHLRWASRLCVLWVVRYLGGWVGGLRQVMLVMGGHAQLRHGGDEP